MVKISRFSFLVVVLFAFLLGTLAINIAEVVSAHGGNAALIHGCVKTSNGSIRIVGASDTCNSGETALDWNIQGIQGIQGEQGPVGPQGPAGGGNSFGDFPFIAPYSNLTPFADQFVENDFSNALMAGSQFYNVDLHGVILDGANLYSLKMLDSDLSSASFVGTDLLGASFGGSDFTGADFTGANMYQGNFLYQSINGYANFTNANLTDANLFLAYDATGVNFTGTIWNNTTCPDGTNSDNNGNTCIGHLVYVEPEEEE